MEQTAKVLCPWCGSEMKKEIFADPIYYRCHECGATSPEVPRGLNGLEKDWEVAYAAAMKRATELNRVLTLQEAYDSTEPCVFVEVPGKETILPAEVEETYPDEDIQQAAEIYLVGRSEPTFVPESDYGVKWRCWLRKPTDEERAAEKWGK